MDDGMAGPNAEHGRHVAVGGGLLAGEERGVGVVVA